jgi:hypothetical protein
VNATSSIAGTRRSPTVSVAGRRPGFVTNRKLPMNPQSSIGRARNRFDETRTRFEAMNVEYEWRRLGLLLYSKAIVQNSYHESQRRMPQSPKELVTEPRSLGEPRNGSPIEFSLNCPKGVVREEITGTYSSGRGQIRSSVQSSLYSQVRFAATQLDKN